MENTNVITITVEEYKDLIRTSVEKEFHAQITGLQEEIKKMETIHAEDCASLKEDSNFWYKRFCEKDKGLDAANARITELEEELSFYKPAPQQEEAS